MLKIKLTLMKRVNKGKWKGISKQQLIVLNATNNDGKWKGKFKIQDNK